MTRDLNTRTARAPWKTVVIWSGSCAVCGTVSALLSAKVCLFTIPALPGAALAYFLTDEHILTDHGPVLAWLVPCNAAAYASLGAWIGDLRNWLREDRIDQAKREGRCQNCDHLLTGNTSGVCPECGTPVSAVNKAKARRRGVR